MLVRFWGTRGSLPAPIDFNAVRTKLRAALLAANGRHFADPAAVDRFIADELPFSVGGGFGGNSSCVQIETGTEPYFICDLGSGAREFGNRVLATHGPARKNRFNIFMSHPHWDHIMGFPFFTPSYIPGNTIRIYGCHPTMREAFERQQSAPCFPVDFGSLVATVEFVPLEPGKEVEIDGVRVRPILQNHAGDSYGYRFVRDGKTVVYSTDNEHKFEVLDRDYPFVSFYQDADVLIFDAMYSLADAISVKEDWGHSSNMVAVELAQMARVKHLVLFHHEPIYDDTMIEAILAETRRYAEISAPNSGLKITAAYDGLAIAL
jgi:phosphoribosyl 1,2-cyclic phosphodiesterase